MKSLLAVKATAVGMLVIASFTACGFKLASSASVTSPELVVCLASEPAVTNASTYAAKQLIVNVHKLSYALSSHNILHRIADRALPCPSKELSQTYMVIYPLMAYETSFSGPIREVTLRHSLYYQLQLHHNTPSNLQNVESEVRFQSAYNSSSESNTLYRIALTTLETDLYNQTATHLNRLLQTSKPSTLAP